MINIFPKYKQNTKISLIFLHYISKYARIYSIINNLTITTIIMTPEFNSKEHDYGPPIGRMTDREKNAVDNIFNTTLDEAAIEAQQDKVLSQEEYVSLYERLIVEREKNASVVTEETKTVNKLNELIFKWGEKIVKTWFYFDNPHLSDAFNMLVEQAGINISSIREELNERLASNDFKPFVIIESWNELAIVDKSFDIQRHEQMQVGWVMRHINDAIESGKWNISWENAELIIMSYNKLFIDWETRKWSGWRWKTLLLWIRDTELRALCDCVWIDVVMNSNWKINFWKNLCNAMVELKRIADEQITEHITVFMEDSLPVENKWEELSDNEKRKEQIIQTLIDIVNSEGDIFTRFEILWSIKESLAKSKKQKIEIQLSETESLVLENESEELIDEIVAQLVKYLFVYRIPRNEKEVKELLAAKEHFITKPKKETEISERTIDNVIVNEEGEEKDTIEVAEEEEGEKEDKKDEVEVTKVDEELGNEIPNKEKTTNEEVAEIWFTKVEIVDMKRVNKAYKLFKDKISKKEVSDAWWNINFANNIVKCWPEGYSIHFITINWSIHFKLWWKEVWWREFESPNTMKFFDWFNLVRVRREMSDESTEGNEVFQWTLMEWNKKWTSFKENGKIIDHVTKTELQLWVWVMPSAVT